MRELFRSLSIALIMVLVVSAGQNTDVEPGGKPSGDLATRPAMEKEKTPPIRPQLFYYKKCHAFLTALVMEKYDDAFSLTSKKFRERVFERDLERLRKETLSTFGLRAVGRSCLLCHEYVIARIVLRLGNYRRLTVYFTFKGDEIVRMEGR